MDVFETIAAATKPVDSARRLALAEMILKQTMEYKIGQIEIVTDSQIRVYTKVNGQDGKTFHQPYLATAMKAIGCGCYIDYDSDRNACCLNIF